MPIHTIENRLFEKHQNRFRTQIKTGKNTHAQHNSSTGNAQFIDPIIGAVLFITVSK